MVEYAYKYRIGLSVYLLQFDGDEVYFTEYTGGEEIRSGIEAVQNLPFVIFYNRFQLKHIPDKQDLFSAERFAQIAGVDAQDAVYRIYDICTYHRNLVYDDQLDLLEQLAVRLGILEKLMNASALKAQVWIVWQDGIKWEFEEAVHRAPSGIDCGNTGRSENDIFLFRIGADIP